VLACRPHRHVLPLELELFGGAALAQEQEPGAVDGPVSKGAVAGKVEGSRGERVREVVADRCCSGWLAMGLGRDGFDGNLAIIFKIRYGMTY
jgi:hypothetical protein